MKLSTSNIPTHTQTHLHTPAHTALLCLSPLLWANPLRQICSDGEKGQSSAPNMQCWRGGSAYLLRQICSAARSLGQLSATIIQCWRGGQSSEPKKPCWRRDQSSAPNMQCWREANPLRQVCSATRMLVQFSATNIQCLRGDQSSAPNMQCRRKG